MNNKYISTIVGLTLIFVFGCKDEMDKQLRDFDNLKDPDSVTNTTSFSYQSLNNEELSTLAINLNKSAINYFKDFEKAVFATDTNKKESKNTNPFSIELNELNIVDVNGKKISFFDMCEKDQHILLDKWIEALTKQLTEKIKFAPQIEKVVKEQDEYLREILNNQTYTNEHGEIKVKDIAHFFSTLNKKIQNTGRATYVNTGRYYGWKAMDTVSLESTKKILAENAKIGYMLVRLAYDDEPDVVIDLSTWNFGHVAILYKDVMPYSTKLDSISITAQTHNAEGNKLKEVRYEYLKEWCKPSYIMEICHWEIVWRGLNTYIKYTPVSNPEDLAKYVEQYIGVRYVYGEEFLVAKSAAPAGFTCASLAWWGSKKVYDINISNFFSTLVTPEDIYLSWHTIIVAKIED